MSHLVAMTGATGFVGRHAVAQLIAAGHRLRALLRSPETAGLPPNVETVAGDLTNTDALAQLTRGADCVVHLAGAITALDRQGYFAVNEQGTRSVVKAAQEAGVSRFVHISSLSAREPQLSDYGASKQAGEDVVRTRIADINAIIIRPPAVYGPGDRGTLPLIKELTHGLAAIPGRREARFSLIHGRDLARIIALAASGAEQGIHEVSDGREYTWADLLSAASRFRGGTVKPLFLPRAIPWAVAVAAESMARLTGNPGMVNRGKVAELYHKDWVCREGTLKLADPTSFENGFAETVQWYRQAGWLRGGRHADTRAASSRTFQ